MTSAPTRAFIAAIMVVLAACGGRPLAPSSEGPASEASPGLQAGTLAEGLVAPWALAFAPDSRLFLSERPGRVRVIEDGVLRAEPVATIDDVAAVGEGGLLGLALHPDFSEEPWLYLYYTYSAENELRNRVVRYQEREGELVAGSRQVILDGIPGAGTHNGGRIAFGPDGKLYVTTGDGARPPLAQDLTSLAGKILRIEADGSVPADNPFPGSAVYTYGHRNPQGLAWQPGTGRLYATEHGATAHDEVNLIQPGQNYGWPLAEGPGHPPPFREPVLVYDITVAPSGAAFYDGSAMPELQGDLFFAALRGAHLRRVSFGGDDLSTVEREDLLFDEAFGRLRDVVQGPDGALYVLTSNRDGRGSPARGDDRVLRITSA